MSRADFWCRVVGWLQIAGGAAAAALILFLWQVVRPIFGIEDVTVFGFIVWVFVVILALPALLSGLFTILFANAVEAARGGLREQNHAALRIFMALTGLWSAGVIGVFSLSAPPIGFFSLLGLITTGIAIMGPDWTADLLKPEDPA